MNEDLEQKTEILNFKVTKSLKKEIEELCERKGWIVSKFARFAIVKELEHIKSEEK